MCLDGIIYDMSYQSFCFVQFLEIRGIKTLYYSPQVLKKFAARDTFSSKKLPWTQYR